MRRFLAALTVVVIATSALADDAKDDKKPKGPKLKVGDAAPALKVSKWLQGTEVPRFEPGKIYVVEFWATWCGPCVKMMPHVAELQAEYRDKGVTIIGFTSADDQGNSADRVAKFVAARGPKLGYTFAFENSDKTYNAWMEAAGQNGIPCAFVVDRTGKLAYIGHPVFLGEVLRLVLAGTWKAKDADAEIEKIEKDADAVAQKINKGTPAEALKALQDFETQRPGMASLDNFIAPRIMLLLATKHVDEAAKAAEAAIAKAVERGDAGPLRAVTDILRTAPEAKGQKALTALSLKSADELVKLSPEDDANALLAAAEAHFAAGDAATARDLGKKVVAAVAGDSEDTRKAVAEIVKRYDEKK
jgi:thiol-disulfide isomerase/thioredoxin